ncbi:MAG TPA: acriflavin resistance protein, partial [Bacteroidetes bacterium]|nr:acriflavin resistance protein [Bacteroidota bacterium]
MRLIEVSIRRKVTILMFTIGILLFGMVSLSRLKINLLPDLSYPTLTIRTDYPGAAPVEIENLVSKPVEEVLGVVKNVTRVRSTSSSGQSDVTLEFAWGTNMDYASMDVREKLDALQLPLEVTRPVILRYDPTLDPIMRFALYADEGAELQGIQDSNVQLTNVSDNAAENDVIETLKQIRRFGDEQVKKDLESAGGVASVKISGGLEEEIQVMVDQLRLSRLNIPVETLINVLRSENINLSGGRLEEGTQQYLVRTLNQFQDISEIRDLVISSRDGRPVYVRDVADVVEGYKEREAITRLNGREAVEVAVYKEGDANTVAVAEAVEQKLARLRETLPPGVKLEKVYDQSTFIAQAVNEVRNAGIIGGILAIIILFIFLRDLKSTLIIGVSIPVSIIATFNLMYGYDITLNIMSLGGIALGIGLLVDNSIVVLENISRHRALGKSVLQAASDGASEVGMAVVASTLTTVAVFFPLVFVEGVAGQLFRDQALTVTFSLLVSLVVAITLIPMLSSLHKKNEAVIIPNLREPKTRFGRWMRAIRLFIFITVPSFLARVFKLVFGFLGRGIMFILNPFLNLFEKSYMNIENRYPSVISWALRNQVAVLATAILIFAGSLFMVPRLGVELIPSMSQGEYNVEFMMPPGTPLERTDEIIRQVQNASSSSDRINMSFAVAGSGNRMDANPDAGGENWGEMNVTLNPGSTTEDEELSMETLRSELGTYPGLQYKFERPALFTFSTPVEIEITGFDLDDLKTAAERVSGNLRKSDRFTDVKSSMEQGHPEIQIVFDREKLSALGLQLGTVADGVVSKIRGDVATRYSWRDRKIDVLVRARDADRSSADDIRNLIVNPGSDKPIPLDAVARIEVTEGPSEIRRIAQQRVAIVSANLNYGDLGTAVEEIESGLQSTLLPSGVLVTTAGQSKEMDVAFESLIFALLLAVFLVYLVMASQFESLIH